MDAESLGDLKVRTTRTRRGPRRRRSRGEAGRAAQGRGGAARQRHRTLLAELELDAKVERRRAWCAEVGAVDRRPQGRVRRAVCHRADHCRRSKDDPPTSADTEKLAALASRCARRSLRIPPPCRRLCRVRRQQRRLPLRRRLTGILTRPAAARVQEQAKAFVAKHDKNGDGKLDLDESPRPGGGAAEREGAAGGDPPPATVDGAQILDAVDAGAPTMCPTRRSIEVGGCSDE